jgi:hypothetical protein
MAILMTAHNCREQAIAARPMADGGCPHVAK